MAYPAHRRCQKQPQEPPVCPQVRHTLILKDEHGDPTFGCDERVVTGKGGRQTPLMLLFIIVIQI